MFDYFSNNRLQIPIEEVDFIRCIFPAYSVYLINKPSFFQKNYILVSSKEVTIPDGCLFISTILGKQLLETNTLLDLIWFITFPDKDKKGKYFSILENMDSEDLILTLKFLLVGIPIKDLFPDALIDSSLNPFDLFKVLFTDFAKIFSVYSKIPSNYKKTFASLLSIFLKIVNLDIDKSLNISNGYLKLLHDNKKHLPEIKLAVKNYIKSKQTEIDFIVLLVKLSNDRFLLR